MGLWHQDKEILESNQIELFIPLISRDNLIGILILDKKKNGRYSLEDLALLQDITSRISVSMEKEYLTEQLKQREEELSIINRSSAIITSSLDIQGVYNRFISDRPCCTGQPPRTDPLLKAMPSETSMYAP